MIIEILFILLFVGVILLCISLHAPLLVTILAGILCIPIMIGILILIEYFTHDLYCAECREEHQKERLRRKRN